jgi:peptide/nickel transport system substrate-binding protein
MIAGSPALDFSRPPSNQRPVSGYVPAKSLDLVRNPSWNPSTDHLRPAYPDRIHVAIGGTIGQAGRAVGAGRADVTFYPGPPPQLPASLIRRYLATPEGRSRLLVHPRDGTLYMTMNLALPPFDDVHVRRAVNYAVDKAAVVRIEGGPATGEITGHVLMDSLEDNLLLKYDPFATPGGRGSLEWVTRSAGIWRGSGSTWP